MQDTLAAWLAAPVMACSLALAACGSSDNGSAPPNDAPVPAIPAEPTLTFHSTKTFRFHWSDVADATHYRLMENPDGLSGFSQVANDITQGTEHVDQIVPLYARTNAQYILQSCVANRCIDSDVVNVSGTMIDSIGYVKASNTERYDWFGFMVSLSADGSTLAVGSWTEDSSATGINGDQEDNAARSSGAVYVFTRNGSAWAQQAYIKASNTDSGDHFGGAVSLSADGDTLAVGAKDESSNAIGIDGDQNDNSASASGAVYVFARSGDEWIQQAYLKASNAESEDRFGESLSLSTDGITLAVGTGWEDSSATGVDGDQSDNSAAYSGAVYVFSRIGDEWDQQAYIKASNTDEDDEFGSSVSLSMYGNALAVGATGERSNATGVNGDQSDNTGFQSGAVYVFTRDDGEWSQQAYIKASNSDDFDNFGHSVSLSADSSTLAIGAQHEASNATGVDGNQADNSVSGFGAVYVFARQSDRWSQQAYIKASVIDWIDFRDYFGGSVSLSANGNTLLIGEPGEDNNESGVNGNQNTSAPAAESSGAAYVFTRSGSQWSQEAYLKASNTGSGNRFGVSVSLSADGKTAALSATGESSNATGVNGIQRDSSAPGAGAVYLY